MPLPRSGRSRGRGRASPANPQPAPRRGRGSSANAVPPRRLGRGRDRTRSLLDDSLRRVRSSAVHFDVPDACEREVISVHCHGERTEIFVAQGIDGRYSTEGVRGRFESIDQLIHALRASWPSPSTVDTPSEEEQHVGSSASARTPQPDGLQHLTFRGMRSKKQQAAEPASAPTAMEVPSSTAASLPTMHITIEPSALSGHSLSSSPIWKQCDFDWEITFYTIKDRGGYYHTFPRVGGPFKSKDKANEAIGRYLTDHEDPTVGMGLSGVEKLIYNYRHFPDGTKRRLKAGDPIDKRRDTTYQLVQAVVYKYNDHHNLFGDRAYIVKDILDERSVWEEENYRMYIHMNFTAKTTVSDGFDTCSYDMFFAEVTYVTGGVELTVNCCCIVKPFENGPCLGCGTPVKHPKDGNAYIGGRMDATYSLPFGPSWGYYEDSDEEVERLRFLLGGAQATAGVPLAA